MKDIRIRALMAVSAIGVAVGAASLAFACTVQMEVRVDPPYAQSGGDVELTGRGYLPGEPVEVRWNSATGVVLGRATGNFSLVVTVPKEAKPGVNYIVVLSPSAENRGGNRATVPIEVLAPGQTEPSKQPGTRSADGSESRAGSPAGPSSASSAGGSPQPVKVGEPVGELGFSTAPAGSPASNPVTNPVSPVTGSDAPATGAGAPVLESAPAVGTPGAPVEENAPTPAASPAPVGGPAESPAGAQVAASPATSPAASPAAAAAVGAGATSAAPAESASAGTQPVGAAAATAEPATQGLAVEPQRRPGPQTAYADLWSGFAPEGSRTPSLIGPSSGGNPSSAPDPAFAVGLLGLGLAGLTAGFALAEARRRKVAVPSMAARD